MPTSPLRDDPAYDVPRWSTPPVAGANVIPIPGPAIGSGGLAGSQTFFRRHGKRAMDIVLAVPILLLASPIIVLAAIAVLVTSGWPVFYGADRQGNGGRQLRVWKLRTMVRDADEIFARWKETESELVGKFEEEFKLEEDPRITRLGRFLRKSSLDELPQLWNVIRGDMSLVGPRPITEDELAMYGHHAATLLSYRPGLSGTWQTNGRGQTTYPDRMWTELEYCRSASLLGDVLVLLKTLAVPFRYNGV